VPEIENLTLQTIDFHGPKILTNHLVSIALGPKTTYDKAKAWVKMTSLPAFDSSQTASVEPVFCDAFLI
jgi:hypothetical protein